MDYPPGVKGYCVQDVKTGQFFNSCDIIFDENLGLPHLTGEAPAPAVVDGEDDEDDGGDDVPPATPPSPPASVPIVPAPPGSSVLKSSPVQSFCSNLRQLATELVATGCNQSFKRPVQNC